MVLHLSGDPKSRVTPIACVPNCFAYNSGCDIHKLKRCTGELDFRLLVVSITLHRTDFLYFLFLNFSLGAGPPDPITNCSLVNITFDMVYIECVEGFNGGLQQHFKANVMTSDFRHPIKSVASRWVVQRGDDSTKDPMIH